MADLLENLCRLRDDLLREYMLARGLERAEVLTKIVEVDDQIESEKERLRDKEVLV